jgi:DNA polymerase V
MLEKESKKLNYSKEWVCKESFVLQRSHNCKRLLMNTLGNVNFAMRDDMVKFAATGTTRNWKMRQEMRSPRYTRRWDELKTVS